MITNTTERLQKIRAKCVELLEIASKRTPGKWVALPRNGPGYITAEVCHGDMGEAVTDGTYEMTDATFIASCAGPAEAGWRATIAAIDNLQLIHEQTDLGEYAAWDALQEILTAWEGIEL